MNENYGITKKIISCAKEIDREQGHDKEGRKVSESNRDGHQGQAGAYHSYKSDCPFKDPRKWRTETKEQAQ